MSTICRSGFVTGRVQGVFYRASTQREATRLGITGWARNCRDGRVEVLLVGDASRVAELERWLWRGPEHAFVDSVKLDTGIARDLTDTERTRFITA